MSQARLVLSSTEHDWRPPELPDLSGYTRVFADFETTGLRWWGRDRPIGLAIATPDRRSWYLPFRHSGGNLDEDNVRRWAVDQLAGKEVGFFNAPFDINMGHVWGLDLEAIGAKVFDLGNQSALLDDSRHDSKLDAIARRYIGRGKTGLITSCLAEYHASEVEGYACNDTLLIAELDDVLRPQIEAQDLGPVLAMEDELLYVTCLMMREGAPIDEEKLHAWIKRSEHDLMTCLWTIYRETGVRVEPGSRPSILRLFGRLGLEPPLGEEGTPEEGKITFKKGYLKGYDHPAIKQLYKARTLASLRSKYLLKYAEELRVNGTLRYSLHQMSVDNEGGTRSGRYSSSGFGTDGPGDGVNIQQVAGKRQLNQMKDDADLAGYVIRELFVPSSGEWLSADAEQIEYRLFAHYAKPERILAAYAADPHTDFHNVVWAMLKRVKQDITRELTKDCNFAAIYGAGVNKWSIMMGITEREARQVYRAYHSAFPEAKQLLNRAMDRASERGFVRTILGRRRRFARGVQSHDALCGVIQGSAADEMKTKLLLLHRNRRATGFKLRFTVHDEVNGDVPDQGAAGRVNELLNTQLLPTTVPLLWKVGTGPNWRECR